MFIINHGDILMSFNISASKIDITPRESLPMAGYIMRSEYSKGVLHNIYARGVLIEGEDGILLLSLELIRIDDELYNDIVELISRKYGLKPEIIHVIATHTHSGPEISLDTWSTLRLNDNIVDKIREYRKYLLERINQLVSNILSVPGKASLYIGKSIIENVASNRIDPRGPVDNEAIVILSQNKLQRKFIAVNYACHPTVLPVSNTYISGDLAGVTSMILEEKLGCPALYLNGAAGNISTRHTRKGQNIDALVELASKIAYSVSETIDHGKLENIPDPWIVNQYIDITVRLKNVEKILGRLLSIEEDITKKLEILKISGGSHGEIRRLESVLEGIKSLLHKYRAFKSRTLSFRIRYCVIGGKVLAIFFPGEAFIEYQLEAKKHSVYDYLVFIGYADGYIGYIPYSIEAYQGVNGIYYEEIVSLVEPEDREKIMEKIIDIASNPL